MSFLDNIRAKKAGGTKSSGSSFLNTLQSRRIELESQLKEQQPKPQQQPNEQPKPEPQQPDFTSLEAQSMQGVQQPVQEQQKPSLLRSLEQGLLRFSNSVNQGLFGINPLKDQAELTNKGILNTPDKFLQAGTPADTLGEKVIEGAGQITGMALPISKSYQATKPLANLLTKGLNPASKGSEYVKDAVTGATAMGAYSTAREGLEEVAGLNDQTIGERAKDVAIETGLGAVGDPLARLAGTGLKKLYDYYKAGKIPKEQFEQIVKQRVGDLPQTPLNRQPFNILSNPVKVNNQNDALSGLGRILKQPQIEAKAQFEKPKLDENQIKMLDELELQTSGKADQLLNDELIYLTNSMKQGVEPGGLITDPITGEVIDRFGRQSNNPKWYQDFFREKGRAPTENELVDLSYQRLREGSPEAPKNDEFLKMEQTLKSIEELRSPKPKVETITRYLDELLPKPQRNTAEVQAFFGPFKNLGSGSGAAGTINRNQVVKNMKTNLGVVIDTGRLRTPKASGIYKVQPEVIRSAMAEDIQTISHEIGHHLDKKFNLQNPAIANEIITMTNHVSPGHLANYQPAQHLEEAIAEYMRIRLTNPQQARQLAPQFTQFLDQTLDAKTLKGLEATTKDIDTWINQGELEQAKGLIDFTSGGEKPKFDFNKWYTSNVDDLNPLKIVEKSIKGSVGIGKDSLYKMARNSRGIAERANLAVSRGIYDDAGNKISKGLAEIVRPLENLNVSEKEFATYLAVKHAADLKTLGKQITFSDGQMRAVLNRLDSPELQAIQREVVDYSNKLMDVLSDAGVISKQAVQDMRKKYPNYVPFMRYFDDDAIAGFKNGGFGNAKGFANLTNPVKRMSEEGSQRTIINPLESIVKNTFLVMNAAAKNKVGLQLAELAKVDGAGAWVEGLGKANKFEFRGVGKEHIVTVFQDGKPHLYKVRDPELYNAMLSLDRESTNSLIRFLGGAASMLRAGATLTPEFIIRNPMRDVVSATINSTQYGFNPIDFFKGLGHVVRRDKVFDQFISSGGAYSTLMSLDRDLNREALEQVFRRSLKEKTLNVVTSPKELAKLLSGYTPAKKVIGGLRKASEVTELATKVGAFNKTLKQTGSLEESAFVARDLMDFNRAGTNIRQANRAVAFLNAAIQGTDRMARGFKENPASFLTRAFTTLVAPSIGLYYWNANLPLEQKEIYDNIPQWQKDSFFIFNIPGTNEFARIPKPFEAGMLFATSTDRFMRWMEENDPEAFKGYGYKVMESMTPPTMITALTPILEAITNHNFFQQRDIVPLGEQRREKVDQYGVNTSLTARLLGQGLSNIPGVKDTNFASPRIIDNTIRGYTAGLGQYAVSGADKAIETAGILGKAPEPSKKLSEMLFIKAFAVNTAGGGQIREDFYNRWEKLDSKKASADFNGTDFKEPDYTRMKKAKSQIDKILKDYKAVQKDPILPPDLKRKRLDEFDRMMNEIARKGLGK